MRLILLNSVLIFMMLLVGGKAMAQSDRLLVYGTVKDERSGKKLTDVQVILVEDGATKKTFVTTLNGKFELDLDFEHDYDIRFTKDGYVTKFININTKGVPEENKVGGFGFDLDMSLFEVVEGVNFDILKKPIGKANYVASTGEIGFDYEYTRSIQAEIARLRRELEKKYKEEEERLLREQQEAERQRKLREQFDQLVAQGDQEFAGSNFMNAVFKYSDALDLISGDAVVEQKLAKAKAALEQQQKQAELEEKYKKLVQEADGLVSSQSWADAKSKYEAALSLKPNEAYPQQQINNINAELEKQKKAAELEKQYKDAIAKADADFSAAKYTEAVTSYQAALKIKPNEQYPADQINKANNLIKELEAQKELEKQYADLITSADASFGKEKYEDAIGLYTEALKIKPSEVYPKDQIAKAKGLIEAAKAEDLKNQKYDEFIGKADKAFGVEQYQDAIVNYQSALQLKPEEAYPKERIAAAEKAIADKKAKQELDKQYNDLIVDADADMNAASYESAINNYEEALKLKPNENYPKEQIAEARKELEQQKKEAEAEQQYKNLIASADKAFSAENYQAAIKDYTAASGLKPNENYPTDQIAKAQKILADRAAQEKAYNDAIAKADAQFNQANYEAAIPAYQEALSMKPGEAYPTEQITKANAELAKLKEAAAKDKQYNDLIAAGDKEFGAKAWDKSIAKYQEALVLKPGEAYPSEQIEKANAAKAEEAKRKELNEQYNKIIADADAKFDAKDYQASIAKYQEAIQLQPQEQYPKDQIGKAQAALDKKAEEEKLAKEYDALIKSADAAFAAKSYEAAINDYTKASGIMPNEVYPQDQIKKAQAALSAAAAQAEKDKKYNDLITAADGKFGAKEYQASITLYRDAINIKPSETYPKDQIAKAEAALDALAKAKEDEAKYNELVAAGDTQFAAEKYNEAIAKYQEALGIKPDASYPKDQISKAQGILDQIARDAKRNEAYQGLIAEADQKFGEAQYEVAIDKYKAALDVKPKEQYPKDQIALAQKELQAKLAAKAQEERYAALLQKGDEQFDSTNYAGAIKTYQDALQIKPEEKYPKDQIAAAKIRQEEQARKAKLREQYQGFVDQGDQAFAKKKYKEAIAHYQDALTLVPGEQYPKDQIAKATEELAKIEEGYNKAVAEGDKQFAVKKYAESIEAYKQALSFKPNESYPQEQIDKATEEMNKPTVVAFTDITAFGEVNKDSVKAIVEKPKEPEVQKNPTPKVMYKTTSEGDADNFRRLLGANYPQGITKEKYNESNKEIFRTIFVEGEFGDELLRVVARFGTFYFKNGSSISSSEYSSVLKGFEEAAN